jgi:2-polyprenyl-3-methyl-5-hydroxy-6-metoxy-1,4-benzoquinol methylase
MNTVNRDMATDWAWEEWGKRDPYFGVITNPKFRRNEMTADSKRDFFESGVCHLRLVMATIHQQIDPQFKPKRALEFGCGVGRILVPLARLADEAVGLDVSPSMLAEAQRNCDDEGIKNVTLVRSDDVVSGLSGTFDFIHSFIVFQHIPVERGRTIFSSLLRHLSCGGVGAIHLTYSKTQFANSHGIEPTVGASTLARSPPRPIDADPEMQMNPYNMNSILFSMQEQKVAKFFCDLTDHGGELGVYLFFRKP